MYYTPLVSIKFISDLLPIYKIGLMDKNDAQKRYNPYLY